MAFLASKGDYFLASDDRESSFGEKRTELVEVGVPLDAYEY